MEITAIIGAYNRSEYLPEQIASIQNQTIPPKEIMVWYNLGETPQLTVPVESAKVAYCNTNFGFFGRFAYALLAKTEYVAIFDDDTVPGEKWFENCLNTMKTHEGIMGTAGIFLNTTEYRIHRKIGWASPNQEIEEVDFVGHGWFFKREWLKYFWMENPPTWENAEDLHFSYTAQKYGNVKTFVPIHPHDDIEQWGSIAGLRLGNDKYASYRKNNHLDLRNFAISESIKNGWKPIFTRKR